MLKKVLVANRGEIACRIIKTLKKMQIKSVAVYSDADEHSLHRKMADESVYLGSSAASESYCNMPKIISAIEASGASAVHPGFGFLAENAAFVRMLEKKKIIFIGPSAHIISKMGDKIEAKKAAQAAGVPVIKGFNDKLFSAAHAVSIAESIGFPVMLKAAAGGGGKGMRVVYNTEDMVQNYNLATNEALKSFGDGTIFIEKYIEDPRHIEIQVICDKHGGVVCLGERECSIQRKHQKIIEEAPSIAMDDRLRKSMYKSCIKLLKQEQYFSAGTIEFLLDRRGNFYFLEMNTRIQVEHTVTEMVTGLDIVELMVQVAADVPLDFTQKDVSVNGWAIESRICAEIPKKDFMPSGGVILKYREPDIDGIRIDSGIQEGDMVTPFYDAMLLKLCVYGKDRMSAIDKMSNALDNFILDGPSTNIEFLSAIFLDKNFRAGKFSTNFIAECFEGGVKEHKLDYKEICTLMVIAAYIYLSDALRGFSSVSTGLANENINIKFLQEFVGSNLFIKHGDNVCKVKILSILDGLLVELDEKKIFLSTDWWFGDNIFYGNINNEKVNVYIKLQNNKYIMRHHGFTIRCEVFEEHVNELMHLMPSFNPLNSDASLLVSPINGMVSAIMVAPGDRVMVGDTLCIITAMKMENVIKAEVDAIVNEIKIKPGDLVNPDSILMLLDVG
ncbi:Propionyl-CoA carboxylase alpha chain [Candidatus Xenohaliotis californiensis]|uniref:propionyl-CoA carboxylase n=1 Tax=Candidatus Xenohaliotis californiensis TaxID=84677 RepID=A0ABM9N7V9_9RICK|nr:Propionyl-CoA carboxylase alpha chain [Candidatus Xenohaliotis californiensis]